MGRLATLALLALSSAVIAVPLSPRQSAAKANTFAIVGNTGVSAQQMFFDKGLIWVVDKVENNTLQIGGHPAWATAYNVADNSVRALDIVTNSFCAGGSHLGNGSWVDVGGNYDVIPGGSEAAPGATGAANPYGDSAGGRAMRLLTPCGDTSCEWNDDDPDQMPLPRWYPSVETLEDGSVLILGGMLYGSFVNSVGLMQNVPTYEFYPSRGAPVNSSFLADTMPANLYPLSWLLPNGLVFMQANWQTSLLNYTSNVETRLPNVTHAQRTYPASGGSTMMPLSSANGYVPTILMCGGLNPENNNWSKSSGWIITTSTSTSCVSINPLDASPVWKDEDDLPEGRGMGNMILLPTGKILMINGVGKGSAGYGWDNWAVNQSYATDPVLRPTIFDPSLPAGSRWSTANLPSSTIPRMYHSSAQLLPDGSVFLAGSNPNVDAITEENNASYVYKTEYRAEIFYPDYYDSARPAVGGAPTSLSYGGPTFELGLDTASARGKNLSDARVVLYRGGFSTHAMQMGQRHLTLDSCYTINADGSATLTVAQPPPNPAIFTPGPAMLFVVLDGVPSVATELLVGSGQIGLQPIAAASVLPALAGTEFTNSSSAFRSSGVANAQAQATGAAAPKTSAAVPAPAGMGIVPALALAGLAVGLLEWWA